MGLTTKVITYIMLVVLILALILMVLKITIPRLAKEEKDKLFDFKKKSRF